MSGRARPVAAPAPLMPLVDRVRAEIRILRTIVEYQNILDVNVLQLWQDRKSQMPILFALMKHVFAVPATSAPSERVFSTAGQISTKTRNRLSGEVIAQLVFVHNFMLAKERYPRLFE